MLTLTTLDVAIGMHVHRTAVKEWIPIVRVPNHTVMDCSRYTENFEQHEHTWWLFQHCRWSAKSEIRWRRERKHCWTGLVIVTVSEPPLGGGANGEVNTCFFHGCQTFDEIDVLMESTKKHVPTIDNPQPTIWPRSLMPLASAIPTETSIKLFKLLWRRLPDYGRDPPWWCSNH